MTPVFGKSMRGYSPGVNIRVLLGFVAALLVGGGGGFAMMPLVGRSPAPPPSKPAPSKTGHVTVSQIRGAVSVLTENGEWRPIGSGERLRRPLVVQTKGWTSKVNLEIGDETRLVLERDARILIGASKDWSVQLEQGLLRLHAQSTVTTHVPGRRVHVDGKTYGVWVRDDDVSVAAMQGNVEIRSGEEKPQKFGVSFEVIVDARGKLTPLAMEPNALSIEVRSSARRGRRFVLNGKTAPSALVLQRSDAGQESLPVSVAGLFSARLSAKDPAEGELIAADTIGRVAEVGRPSLSFGDVVKGLTGQKMAPSEATPPPETPAPAAAQPASLPPPAKAAPARPARPEAARPEASGRPPRAKPAAEGAAKRPRRNRAAGSARSQETPPPIPVDFGSKAQPPPAVKVRKPEASPSGAKAPPPPPAAEPEDEEESDDEEPL